MERDRSVADTCTLVYSQFWLRTVNEPIQHRFILRYQANRIQIGHAWLDRSGDAT